MLNISNPKMRNPLFLVFWTVGLAYGTSSDFQAQGCFFSIKPAEESAEIGSITNIRSNFKDCVILFHPARGKKLNLMFDRFEALSEEVDSCVSSYTKILSVDDSGDRIKLAHYCNSLPTNKLIVFDTVDRIELVIFQSNIKLKYEYVGDSSNIKAEEFEEYETEDKNVSTPTSVETIITFRDSSSKAPKCQYPQDKDCTNLDKDFFRTQSSKKNNSQSNNIEEFSFENASPPAATTDSLYSTGRKSECEQNMQFVCKFSRFCGEGDGILCNETMYLCINPIQSCNGVQDCIGDDSSDEFRCFFPYMSNSLFGVVGIFISCLSLLCSFNHKTSLRKNNMVRYNGDVLKRKDVIKAKKINTVEKETSNELLAKPVVNNNSNNGKSAAKPLDNGGGKSSVEILVTKPEAPKINIEKPTISPSMMKKPEESPIISRRVFYDEETDGYFLLTV